VTVAGIFVMSAGLMRTGGSDHLTRLLRRLGGRGERRLIAATVLLVGLLSSIMNNIGAAIIMMPAVLAAGRDAKVPAGRLLIPLAFGALLGGLTTAVGPPPKLLVNAALTARGYAPFGLFDFTPTGLAGPAAAAGRRRRGGRHRPNPRLKPASAGGGPARRGPPRPAGHGRAGPAGAGGARARGRRPPGNGGRAGRDAGGGRCRRRARGPG